MRRVNEPNTDKSAGNFMTCTCLQAVKAVDVLFAFGNICVAGIGCFVRCRSTGQDGKMDDSRAQCSEAANTSKPSRALVGYIDVFLCMLFGTAWLRVRWNSIKTTKACVI